MVLWSRWTSYYSNSFTSIVPVGALLDTGLPVPSRLCRLLPFCSPHLLPHIFHVRLLLQTPLLGHCSDLRGRKPWPPAFLLHRAGKWREKALLAWPAKPWRAALLLLWQLHFIDYRMQTNHLPAPFRPIAVPMQACAYTPLPIVLLHLTSGLPLLVYNVVQASSVHSGPLPACMPAALLRL